MQIKTECFPTLGFGLGLRIPHYKDIFEHTPQVDWFEIISENFMDTGGQARTNLARIRERYPVVMHGVALSIGTVDPLNSDYLKKLKLLAHQIKPAWISDHLCWTGIAHKNTHDLLPVPYTAEALKHIVTRIKQVQDYLERPIALENPSTYLEFSGSDIPEAEFISAMAIESGCHLLLDINNVYVNCYNHGLDPQAYIDALPLDRVVQIHLSGHSNFGTHIIDTHDDYVIDPVWSLYKYVTHQAGRVLNTMIEWDDNIPSWDILYAELEKAQLAATDAKNYAPLPKIERAPSTLIDTNRSSLQFAQLRLQESILLRDTDSDDCGLWIRGKEGFKPAAQLAVYRNAYRYRLFDVTAVDYPLLKQYLGVRTFDGLIKRYVEQTSSRHFNIGRYASHLPKFVAEQLTLDVFAYELATFENALVQMHDPEETVALTPEHLAAITADLIMASVLAPRLALQLFAFTYPVNDYYIAVYEADNQADAAAPPLRPEPSQSYVVVFRHEDVVWRMELAENEHWLLEKLFAGTPINQALEDLQAEFALPDADLSEQIFSWFSRWMRNGLLRHDT